MTGAQPPGQTFVHSSLKRPRLGVSAPVSAGSIGHVLGNRISIDTNTQLESVVVKRRAGLCLDDRYHPIT
jgi:hypothetical protein